jgi:hypothetical protein
MVEQVARALCAARYNAPEGKHLPAFKQAQVEKHWQLFVDDARIAIEAMREPTDDMVRCRWGWVMGLAQRDVLRVWQDMIDAADPLGKRDRLEREAIETMARGMQPMIDAALNGTKSTT